MNKLLITLAFSGVVLSAYTNCEFKNDNYEDICERAIERGVSHKYINQFLLSCENTKNLDEKSWEYLHPSKVKVFKKNEKRANNKLLPHVPRIVRHLKKYSHVYDFTEKEFGVNREIVAAILMKETALGSIKLKHDAFKVCNTIVVKNNPKTPREEWLMEMGKSNMVSIIEHCYEKNLGANECNLPSSYAGAVGIPQFMPNSFEYAQGYKTKMADLNKMEDAIVSASKFLHKKATFDKLINWDRLSDIELIESAWYDYEMKYEETSLVYERNKRDNYAYKCFLCDAKGYQYLRAYAKKIMVYNNSSNYAIGVIRLAYESHVRLMKK